MLDTLLMPVGLEAFILRMVCFGFFTGLVDQPSSQLDGTPIKFSISLVLFFSDCV